MQIFGSSQSPVLTNMIVRFHLAYAMGRERGVHRAIEDLRNKVPQAVEAVSVNPTGTGKEREMTEIQQFISMFLNILWVDNGNMAFHAVTAAKVIRSLLNTVGYRCSKIVTNHDDVRAVFGRDELTLDDQGQPPAVTSILGVPWHIRDDMMGVGCQDTSVIPDKTPVSKHLISAKVGAIYDPLGLVSPWVLEGKLCFQQAHFQMLEKAKEGKNVDLSVKIQWNLEVSQELTARFKAWHREVPLIPLLKVPRWLGIDPEHDLVTIIVATDASRQSMECMCACESPKQGHRGNHSPAGVQQVKDVQVGQDIFVTCRA